MNKKLWIVFLVAACLTLTVPISSTAETVSISFTTQNPELGWGQVETLKPWIAKIEKATNGKVKFNVYYSQTLAKGPDTWNAVKTGIADSGWCFHAYWPGMTPLSDVVSLPSIPYKTAESLSGAYWKLYEKFPSIKDEYKDNHIVLLYTSNENSIEKT